MYQSFLILKGVWGLEASGAWDCAWHGHEMDKGMARLLACFRAALARKCVVALPSAVGAVGIRVSDL